MYLFIIEHETLKLAIKLCTKLRVIKCRGIDLSLKAVKFPSSLEELDISYNSVISDKDFYAAIQFCTKLYELNCSETRLTLSGGCVA